MFQKNDFEKFKETWDRELKMYFSSYGECFPVIKNKNRKFNFYKNIKYHNISFKDKHLNWHSPDNLFGRSAIPPKMPTNKSGVYLIIINWKEGSEVIYVGSAKNLLIRYSNHEVINELIENDLNLYFYFKECFDYSYQESVLTKLLQPRLNIRNKK